MGRGCGLGAFRRAPCVLGAQRWCTEQTMLESADLFMQQVQKLLKHTCNEANIVRKPWTWFSSQARKTWWACLVS